MAKTLIANTATFQINLDIVDKNANVLRSISVLPKSRACIEHGEFICELHKQQFAEILRTAELPDEENPKAEKEKQTLPNKEVK